MPRTSKPTGGGKRHPLNMRTTKEIRDRLEAVAAANGRSLAQEVEARLERSFLEEQSFGGPELHQLAHFIIMAFARAGKASGAGKEDWINDPNCYRAGVIGVLDALLIDRPDEHAALIIESLKGRLLSRVVRRVEQDT